MALVPSDLAVTQSATDNCRLLISPQFPVRCTARDITDYFREDCTFHRTGKVGTVAIRPVRRQIFPVPMMKLNEAKQTSTLAMLLASPSPSE